MAKVSAVTESVDSESVGMVSVVTELVGMV